MHPGEDVSSSSTQFNAGTVAFSLSVLCAARTRDERPGCGRPSPLVRLSPQVRERRAEAARGAAGASGTALRPRGIDSTLRTLASVWIGGPGNIMVQISGSVEFRVWGLRD